MRDEGRSPNGGAEEERRASEILRGMSRHSRVRDILARLGVNSKHSRILLHLCAKDPLLPDRKRNYLGADAKDLQTVREFSKALGRWAGKIRAFDAHYYKRARLGRAARPLFALDRDAKGELTIEQAGALYAVGFPSGKAERAVAALEKY